MLKLVCLHVTKMTVYPASGISVGFIRVCPFILVLKVSHTEIYLETIEA